MVVLLFNVCPGREHCKETTKCSKHIRGKQTDIQFETPGCHDCK